MEATKSLTWIAFYMVVALGVAACSPEKGRPKHVPNAAAKIAKADTTDYEGEEVVAPVAPTAAPQAPAPAPTAAEPEASPSAPAAPATPAQPTAPDEGKPVTPAEPVPTTPVKPVETQPQPQPVVPVDPVNPPVQNPDPFPTSPRPEPPVAPEKPQQPLVPPSENLFPEQPARPNTPRPPAAKPIEKPVEKQEPKPEPKPERKPEPKPEQPLPRVAYPELPAGWNPVHWEAKSGSGRAWSRIAVGIIRTKAQGLYKGASDMSMFCPNYANLSNGQRENVWVGIFSAIAFFESSYNPTTYAVEPIKNFPKLDAVTGKRVASEGLLQLSYQDKKSFPKYCGEFDWDRDEDYPARDPRKTILNPRINLSCGIQIMHHKVLRENRIAISHRPYWAVLSPTNVNSKLDRIVGMVSGLPICKTK